jgi:hypothetical protein
MLHINRPNLVNDDVVEPSQIITVHQNQSLAVGAWLHLGFVPRLEHVFHKVAKLSLLDVLIIGDPSRQHCNSCFFRLRFRFEAAGTFLNSLASPFVSS